MISAPDFSSRTQYGTEVTLGGLLAESAVLLVFYPYAFSATCTGELDRLSEIHHELAANGVRLAAISCDAMFSQRVFAESQGFDFWLLTDFWPHGEIARRYQVFDADLGCSVRGSFLVERSGPPDATASGLGVGRIAWSVVNPIGTARNIDDHLVRARELAGTA